MQGGGWLLESRPWRSPEGGAGAERLEDAASLALSPNWRWRRAAATPFFGMGRPWQIARGGTGEADVASNPPRGEPKSSVGERSLLPHGARARWRPWPRVPQADPVDALAPGARGGGSSRRRFCAPSVLAGGSPCASTGVERVSSPMEPEGAEARAQRRHRPRPWSSCAYRTERGPCLQPPLNAIRGSGGDRASSEAGAVVRALPRPPPWVCMAHVRFGRAEASSPAPSQAEPLELMCVSH